MLVDMDSYDGLFDSIPVYSRILFPAPCLCVLVPLAQNHSMEFVNSFWILFRTIELSLTHRCLCVCCIG